MVDKVVNSMTVRTADSDGEEGVKILHIILFHLTNFSPLQGTSDTPTHIINISPYC